ncbi:MAG: mercuric reductase [Elusimicrobia bacterium]|nr:mercuric reductase [Elusimicrobiota bacterium]
MDAHDERLAANARPADWRNPEPVGRYNLVVVGAGTAGLVSAAGAAGLGAKVALVEKHLMGGDCLNVGCVPSKALLASARAAARVRDAGRFGVKVPEGVSVDFPAVMERMRRLRADLSPNDSAARFKGLGVDVFLGAGRFTGRDSLEVDGRTLRFAKAVVATGARAARLPIPGLWEAGALTNESVFSLTELPRRLLVIGAGPIGVELSQAFARFGARVTLVETEHGLLPREDRDAAAVVQRAVEKDGVELVCCAKVERVEARGTEKVLRFSSGHGPSGERAFDAVLVGVGRAPNVEGLGLEAAGVAFGRQGVTVDDFLRTTNPRVYAAGDVCLGAKFTHAADFSARLVLQNALFMGRRRWSSLVVPWCTYTDPEVAHVGLYEKEAADRGLRARTFTQPLTEVDRAVLDGESEGFVKTLVEEGSGRLLGATVVAAHAGDLVGELSAAMTRGIGLAGLASVIHPYPTQAEAVRRLGDAYNRTRLTPGVRRLMGKWLSWTR